MKRLNDKVCVITGGGSGIGYASVLRFLSEGARVVLVDINQEKGQQRVEEISARGDGERIRFFPCDVSDEAQVIRMIRFTTQEFGGIDSIFNNAGIGGAFGRLIDTRVEDWDRTQIHLLRSTFLCVKHAALAMIHNKRGGSIVNNASFAARFGDLAGAAYSAAKAGVVNITKTAAIQLAENYIRVNVILPGFISTPLNHRGQDLDELEQWMISKQAWPEAGKPEHIASVAAFLSSDESRFITGAELVVDGGYTAGGRGLYQSGHPLGREIATRMQAAGVRHFDFGNTGLKE